MYTGTKKPARAAIYYSLLRQHEDQNLQQNEQYTETATPQRLPPLQPL